MSMYISLIKGTPYSLSFGAWKIFQPSLRASSVSLLSTSLAFVVNIIGLTRQWPLSSATQLRSVLKYTYIYINQTDNQRMQSCTIVYNDVSDNESRRDDSCLYYPSDGFAVAHKRCDTRRLWATAKASLGQTSKPVSLSENHGDGFAHLGETN